jgi:hypothetical protein
VDVPHRGLRSTDIRNHLTLESLLERALRQFQPLIKPGPKGQPRFGGHWDRREEERADDSLAAVVSEGRKGRARQRDDIYYARVAHEYAKVVRTKKKGVYLELHNRLGWSRKYLPDLVKEARRRGLLTKPPGRGQVGGRLTKKAERILERTGDGDNSQN